MDYTKHWKTIFESYIEASEYAIVRNGMKPWTHECIKLGYTCNIQGYLKKLWLVESRSVSKMKIQPCLRGLSEKWNIGQHNKNVKNMEKHHVFKSYRAMFWLGQWIYLISHRIILRNRCCPSQNTRWSNWYILKWRDDGWTKTCSGWRSQWNTHWECLWIRSQH